MHGETNQNVKWDILVGSWYKVIKFEMKLYIAQLRQRKEELKTNRIQTQTTDLIA